jgi:NADH-quinone oxidoreductase subunit M
MLKEISAGDQIGFPILSLMIFLPLAGAIVIGWLREVRWIRRLALAVASVNFGLSIFLFARFEKGTDAMQFVEHVAWVPPLGIGYHVGVDGISLFLVILTALLFALLFLFSWDMIGQQFRTFALTLLVLETAVLGIFSALDFVLFFFCWEGMLIPMYFLIKIWGSGPRRDDAALKYIVYTLIGSVLMLVGFILVYLNYHDYALLHHLAQPYSFDLLTLLTVPVPPERQLLIFVLLFFGFGFKGPIIPFHTWLPDVMEDGPIAVAVILSGVKMATYGLLRFNLSLLPEASHQVAPIMMTLAVIGIVYGAFIAISRLDLMTLMAYSGISHLGFVVLGLFTLNSLGLQGSLLHMINLGISGGGMMFIMGFLLRRQPSTAIAAFGGWAKRAPFLAMIFLAVSLASIAVPGTNVFISEFMILAGVFKTHLMYAAIGVGGVVLGAVYILSLYGRVMLGNNGQPSAANLFDLNRREATIGIILAALIIVLGLYPRPVLERLGPSIQTVAQRLDGGDDRRAIVKASPEADQRRPGLPVRSRPERTARQPSSEAP